MITLLYLCSVCMYLLFVEPLSAVLSYDCYSVKLLSGFRIETVVIEKALT